MDSMNETGQMPVTGGNGGAGGAGMNGANGANGVSGASPRPTIPDFNFDPEPVAPVTRKPYVRKQTPRRTQEAIDDLAQNDNPATYTHESDIAIGGMVGDRNYRKARSEITQFQKNNRYGQYLQVPKGRRSIFAKQERSRRRKSAIAAIIVIGILAAAAYLVWQLMSNVKI